MDSRNGEKILGSKNIPAMFWVQCAVYSLFILPIPWVLLSILREFTNSFHVTTHRVTGKQGLFGTSEFDFPLDKIAMIQSNQSLIGKILNFGSVSISDNGGASAVALSAAPQKFKAVIFNAQEKYKEEQMVKMGQAIKAA